MLASCALFGFLSVPILPRGIQTGRVWASYSGQGTICEQNGRDDRIDPSKVDNMVAVAMAKLLLKDAVCL